MAKTKILLLEPVAKLGDEGQAVEVKPGFFRNFLGPRKMAIPFSRGNRKQMEALQQRREARRAQELGHAQELASKLGALRLAIAVKTGEQGRMFGSVTSADLSQRIQDEAGITIDRKHIQLYNPIKTLGQHSTKIKLHPEVSAQLQFEVVSENPIAEEETKEDA